jgi:CelD/BcsL family acetyltransferase involved in cellulose biosynthesis
VAEVAVDEVQTIERAGALREEWRALAVRCPRATVFQSPEWLLGWARTMMQGDLHLVTLRARPGGDLVGLAPLFSWRDGEARVLSLMGAGVSDYQDVVFDPVAAPACLEAFEAWLADTGRCWQRLFWSEVPAGSPLLEARVGGETAEQDVCPGIPLAGAARIDEVLPRHQLKEVGHARRRGQRELDLAYEEGTPENLEDLLGTLARLHHRRWQQRGCDGVLADHRVQSFHRCVARELLAAGKLMLHAVRLRGERAGVVLGFHDGRVTRSYISGFDPGLRKYSPGVLAIARAVESALARGMDAFDFLRGAERFKYDWGARDLGRVYRRVAAPAVAHQPT